MLLGKSHIAVALCFAQFTVLAAQGSISTSGISFSYHIDEDKLVCRLAAKTTGWVGVGFNSQNSIVSSDLLLFNIIDGNVSSRDLYVKGFGDPREDIALGGSSTVKILSSEEAGNTTTVQFSIPLDSKDPYDFVHRKNEEFWLILAYSIADEFEHHSRVRKHIRMQLE